MTYRKGLPGFYSKIRRSDAFAAFAYTFATKPQYDNVSQKFVQTLASFVKDKVEAKVVEKYFVDKGEEYWQKGYTRLSTDFKDPPPKDGKKGLFQEEDCADTTDDILHDRYKQLSAPLSEDTYDVSYRFTYKSLEIRGKNIDQSRISGQLRRLRERLSGSDDMTGDKPEWIPNDVNYHWSAPGQTVMSDKGRTENAVESVGESSNKDYYEL